MPPARIRSTSSGGNSRSASSIAAPKPCPIQIAISALEHRLRPADEGDGRAVRETAGSWQRSHERPLDPEAVEGGRRAEADLPPDHPGSR